MENVLIPITVLVPLVAALMLLAPAFNDRRAAFLLALGATLVTFVLSVVMALTVTWRLPFDARITLPWVDAFGISFGFGLDAISIWLVLLSTFLMPLVILASDRQAGDQPRQFYFWLLMVQAAMVGCFVATDVLFFFLCFEFTLVPIYFLIGIYGGRDRAPAARMFFIYTFAGSMLTFAGLLYVAYIASVLNTGVWSFSYSALATAAASMTLTEQGWVLAAMLAGFAVKVPIFPLHTWLPLTYREAPTAGTVILAAVLAKLGTYALLRFALPFCPDAAIVAAPAIAILAIVAILYCALICWVQKDLKKLIAYSSISHLGFIVLGLFALDAEAIGAVGATIYMVNHGLIVGGLFLCAGMLHDRVQTYEMSAFGGLVREMPLWAFFMVFFAVAAVGLPGLNGFVGEFLTLLGAFVSSRVLGMPYAIVAAFGLILGAIYVLYMVGRVVFGPVKIPAVTQLPPGNEPLSPTPRRLGDLTGREIAALAPIAVVCVALGLYPQPVLETLDPAVRTMTAGARHAAAASPGSSTLGSSAGSVTALAPTANPDDHHAHPAAAAPAALAADLPAWNLQLDE